MTRNVDQTEKLVEVAGWLNRQQQRAREDQPRIDAQRREKFEKTLQGIRTSRPTGRQTDITFLPDGKPDTRNARVIQQWSDGQGGFVYVADNVNSEAGTIQVVDDEFRAKILKQKSDFSALDEQARAGIRKEFDASRGKDPTSGPYHDFLQSDALEKRFQQLQDSRPKPPPTR